MQVSLSQIRAKLAECEALRDDALDTVRRLALSRLDAPASERQALVSKFDGYEREFWALVKIERELISCGVATTRRPGMEGDESSPLPKSAESRFNAPVPESAPVTPAAPSDAQMAPREAPRSETAGFSGGASWDAPETAEMTAAHYAAGDGF